jgi:hypothetical protein
MLNFKQQMWKEAYLVEQLMVRIRKRELTSARSPLPWSPLTLADWAERRLSDDEYIEIMFYLYAQQRYRFA